MDYQITIWVGIDVADHGLPSSCFNSLAYGKFKWNFRYAIFKQILVIGGWGISCEIAPIWMSLDFTDDQSTLVQVMAWCRKATSHYLSQCWPRPMSSYGVTRPQWVNGNNIVSKCCNKWQLNRHAICKCYIPAIWNLVMPVAVVWHSSVNGCLICNWLAHI